MSIAPLILVQNKINDSTLSPLLKQTMRTIWNSMSNYYNIIPLANFEMQPISLFKIYVKPTISKFLTNIVDHYESGSYEPKHLSMCAYYSGNQSPIVYICSIEYYDIDGTNQFVLFYKLQMENLYNEIVMMRNQLQMPNTTNNDKIYYRKSISSKVDEIRQLMFDYICVVFEKLVFFDNYQDAKKFILHSAQSSFIMGL